MFLEDVGMKKSFVQPSGSRGMETLERPAGFRSEIPAMGTPAKGNQRWGTSDGSPAMDIGSERTVLGHR
jgi:hypothetical protein